MARMKQKFIKNFAKLWTSGLRFTKKMVVLSRQKLPVKDIQENLFYVLILTYIKL